MLQLFTGRDTRRRFVEAAADVDLSPSMLRALLSLNPGEHVPMRALVEDWHCDPSWVTSVVDELERRGLVERRVDQVDRRAKTVTITAVGQRQREKVEERLAVPPPGIAALSAPEQRALRDLMCRVTTDLSTPDWEPRPP